MSTMYYGNSEGRWWKTEYPAQCKEHVPMAGQCQRQKGHTGDHWCYSGRGDYCWSANRKEKKLKKWDVAAGSTPPGHSHYIEPVEKWQEVYTAFRKESEVTSKKLLNRLDRGEFKPGESVTRPCKDE